MDKQNFQIDIIKKPKEKFFRLNLIVFDRCVSTVVVYNSEVEDMLYQDKIHPTCENGEPDSAGVLYTSKLYELIECK